jgi:hypothetical protein
MYLPVFAQGGGPCNAGILFMMFGFILLICSTITAFAIRSIFKSIQKGQLFSGAITLSICSSLLWFAITVAGISDDHSVRTLLFIIPFSIMELIIIVVAFYKHTKPQIS